MAGIHEILGGFSGAKGRLLFYAAIIVLCGAVWNVGRDFLENENRGFGTRSGPKTAKTGWVENSATKIGLLKKGDRWGDAAVRLGLSFGFAMIAASILRHAFKFGVMILVVAGAVLWLLKTQGVVNLWDNYYGTVKGGGDWLGHHLVAIRDFLAAHLPSAGAALVGFGFGLRR